MASKEECCVLETIHAMRSCIGVVTYDGSWISLLK